MRIVGGRLRGLGLAALYGLMRAFAPDFTTATINRALSVFDVAVPPPPEPVTV